MTPPINQQLRTITSFPTLVEYLCDELDWPINVDDFESYTFEWDAVEDLGVAPEHAAKINEIKQLRPLSSNQPWGIFFIDFEPKKLPVGVLRRLLNKLVTKKRASANPSDQQTWNQEDLLFISSFGEQGMEPELAFAHFHHNEGDLPTLRVLGWDGGDTPLKLDHVDKQLHASLHWPDGKEDFDEWRQRWSTAFRHRIGHTIQTADMLATALAELAKNIRDRCQVLMAAEPENGPLKKLYKAFKAALIHDLTEETFADTYAQTITYGLLTAAISRTDRSGSGGGTYVQADNITDMVPVTNPFLKEMLQSFLQAGGRTGGLDFDELGVQDVVELLRDDKQTDLAAVLRDFGNRNPNEDPVIRFYEHFLAAYNKELKVKRGVFYTPQPVVSYIVRSVHELLQTEFDLEDGLASTATWGAMITKNPKIKLPPLTDEPSETRTIDPSEFFVQILDPATGTGTFIVETIDVIHKHLSTKWEKGGLESMPSLHHSTFDIQYSTFGDYWNQYVPAALLPRLYAYELLMAPYAIAHMKIGLKLHETGYLFASDERVRVYLTNALEPKVKQLPQIGFEALAHEAAAVNEVKWYKRFSVVIGNPPYAGLSANMTNYAQRIVDAYKIVDGASLNERKLWLQDDYVKFIRKAQTTIDCTNVGVFGYITNHGFLDNPTFRGMRQSLMETYPRLRVVDLHGNINKKEKSSNDSKDQNVFDIRQGVSICLATRSFVDRKVQHTDLLGCRESKYCWLAQHSIGDTMSSKLHPDSPFYFFKPQNIELRSEYQKFWSLTHVFAKSGVGMVTARDALTIDFEASRLWDRVKTFASLSTEQARHDFGLGKDVQSWQVAWAQADVSKTGPNRQLIYPVLYRPFDQRYTYYTGKSSGFICRPVYEVMRHMLSGDNLALISARSNKSASMDHFFVTRLLAETKSGERTTQSCLFPLYLQPEPDSLGCGLDRRVNFTEKFVEAVNTALGLTRKMHDSVVLPQGLGYESIFHYIYAVFHNSGYRNRYAEFLKIDFPRLPLTSSLDLFRELARLGEELVALHLMESPKLDNHITEFVGESRQVVKVVWTEENGGTVWIDGAGTKKAPRAGSCGFQGVTSEVWNFHIGGYQVCEKWLKDRGPKKGKPGRILTDDDINHYHKIVVALTETIRLMAEIDQVIDSHGGWPDAFVTEQAEGKPS